jgi:hypothetical protein
VRYLVYSTQFDRGSASHNDDISARLQQLEHSVAQQNNSIDNLKSVVVAEQQQSIQVHVHPLYIYVCVRSLSMLPYVSAMPLICICRMSGLYVCAT